MKQSKTNIVISFLLGFILLSACSGPDTGPFAGSSDEVRQMARESFTKLFHDLDQDGDGYLYLSEFKDSKVALFRKIDTDGDRVIEPHELPGDSSTIHVLPYDLDGDGSVDKEEFKEYYRQLFENYLDRSGRGKVSLKEFLSAFGLA